MSFDILLDINGDIPVYPTLVRGPEIVRQTIALRLGIGRGTAVLNQTKGVPWLELLQAKPVDTARVVQVLTQEIEDVPGVSSVVSLQAAYDNPALTLTISGQVVIQNEVFDLSANLSATNLSESANPWFAFLRLTPALVTP